MYSFGIEEEYFVFDAKTRRAVKAASKKFIASAKKRLGESVTTEMLQSQIEAVSPPCASTQEARGHMSGLRRALFESRFYLHQSNAAGLQQHQQMIKKIGRFCDQPAIVILHGGQSRFDGLLAQLLGAMSDALVDEGAGIGVRRARLGALVDPPLKVSQGKLAHGSLFARPQ